MSNAKKYQQSQKEISIQLVKDAIEHIQSFSGVINQSTVSRITYDLADESKKQKGLTPGAISKNETYRALVEEAIAVGIVKSTSSLKDYSQADIRIQLAALRVQYSNLKDENKILNSKLEEQQEEFIKIKNTRFESIQTDEDGLVYKHALKDMVKSLLLESVCYIDKDTDSLKLALYEVLLLDENLLSQLDILGDDYEL